MKAETRHTFRLDRVAWNASLGLRFELSFVPAAAPRSRFAVPHMARVVARRVHWWDEGELVIAETPRTGTVVEHIRAVGERWGAWLKEGGARLVESEDVRCRHCRGWRDPAAVLCGKCKRVA